MEMDQLDLMISDLIQRFSTGYQSGQTDFSHISSIFCRLLQTMTDPPLEIVWFYSSLTFEIHNVRVQELPNRVLLTRDLFTGIVSCCSCSLHGIKKIAALAPVVYEVYKLVVDENYSQCKIDIDFLVEGIVSYISMVCWNDFVGTRVPSSIKVGKCFDDVIRTWTINEVATNESDGYLRAFFPLVSDDVRRKLNGGCQVGDLAGVVICEAFLMSMCLKIHSGVDKEDLKKHLKSSVRDAISGFRSFYFIDVLLRTLLEPILPVTSLMVSADSILLQEALFDAAFAVGNSFFDSNDGTLLQSDHARKLAVTWLFVADNAYRFIRRKGDMNTFISYQIAFSESRVPSLLVKWVMDQIATGEKITMPNISSPMALIKWLLTVEDQVLRLFDKESLKLLKKAAIYKTEEQYKFLTYGADIENLGHQFFKYLDNGEQQEEEDQCVSIMEDCGKPSCVTDILTSNSFASVVGRKRKEEGNDIGDLKVKFLKVHMQSKLRDEEGFSSGSEVDNPVVDEDMNDIEQ